MNSGIDALKIKNRDFLFFAVVIGGAALFLTAAPMPILCPILILLCGLVSGILIIAIFVPEDFKFLSGFYLIGLIVRAFFSYLFYILAFVFKGSESEGFLFSNDGYCYSEQGWQIYKLAEKGVRITQEGFLLNPNIKIESGNITLYDFFNSFVYSITGKSPLSLFFISSVAGSTAALFIYLIAKELFSKRVARISSLFAFFWPSFIMWSTQNLKEPMIAMFTCILIWTIFYMYRHHSPGFLILSIISAWVLSRIALPYLTIVIYMLFFAGLFLFINHLFKNKFVSILIIGLLFLVSIFYVKQMVTQGALKGVFYNIKGYSSVFEFLSYHRNVRTYGKLQFLKSFDTSNFGRAILFAPIGMFYAIFAPFPWQLGSIAQVMAFPETVVFYMLFPVTLKGIVFAYRKRFNQSIWLLSIIMVMFLIFALVEGNIGTLFRHRSIPLHLLFIFTGVGIALKKKLKWQSRLYT